MQLFLNIDYGNPACNIISSQFQAFSLVLTTWKC